ncbi:MAG: GspH/FimT family pseudopilin [Deltaproteobacteria bacterium]|nr:GspH/FimT family pseudopilin [Deltaproteobacteria bacterium]
MKKHDQHRLTCGGFSLLELLTVLLMLGVMAGVVAPSVGSFLAGFEFRKQVGEIMANLRAVRLQAVVSGRQVKVSIQENNFLLNGGKEEQLVKVLELNPESALELKPGTVIFTPRSTVTPATLSFSMGNRSRTIVLDPLTGLPVIQ